MKNPYNDILGTKVEVDGEDYYVAFIEPDKGITCKKISDGKVYCIAVFNNWTNTPVDMSQYCVTDEKRIILDKTLADFHRQVKETGKYIPDVLPEGQYEVICPSESK